MPPMTSSDCYNMGEMSYTEFSAYRQKRNTDYISRLWQQQRDLMNREQLLTQRAHQDSKRLTSKFNKIPFGKSMEASSSERRQVFQSRIKPSFNRGKTVVLAVDPERHIQLEKERIALQEQRNRPKSPIQLIPIDVKPLGHLANLKSPNPTKEPQKAIKQNNKMLSHSVPSTLSSSIELWKRPAQLLGKKLSGNIPETPRNPTGETKSVLQSLSITMKTCENIHTMNNLAKFCRPSVSQAESQNSSSKSDEPSSVMERLSARRAIKPRKPITGFGSYSVKPPAQDTSTINLLLEAKGVIPPQEDDPMDAVWKAQSSRTYCCNSEDEDCSVCGKYSSNHLPLIPYVARSYSNIHSKSRQPVSSPEPEPIEAESSKTLLVVQLPNIGFTPATPPRLICPPNQPEITSSIKTFNVDKIQKRKELRLKELTNLCSDISELNHVNIVLVKFIKNS